MKKVEIKNRSGTLSATVFGKTNDDIVLIIASATGVRQEYYQKFAEYMAGNDIVVLTFDYNGIGHSLNKPIKEYKNNASDWGANDIESIIQYVMTKYPKSKKIILGHSIGGQLIGLAKSSPKMDKVILVAAQSGYWKYWNGFGRIKMWFNWYVLFPFLLNIFGYLSSKKISGMEDLPKNVANQWRNWGKHKDYILSDRSIKETYYHELDKSLTSYSLDDDDFAPRAAVEWMTGQYLNAKVKAVHLRPVDFDVGKIGHFGIFKNKFKKTIWTQLLKEIK